MHPGVFFGFALFFGIFWLSGGAAHNFMLYVIGFTAVGVFVLLMGLAIPKRWELLNKSFQTKNNLPTIIVKCIILFAGLGMLYSSINYWRDVPFYLKERFAVVRGKPVALEVFTEKGGGTDVYLIFEGVTLELYPEPKYDDPMELKDINFTVYYLPNTSWAVKYEIEWNNSLGLVIKPIWHFSNLNYRA